MASGGPRLTAQTLDVLTALLADPTQPLYGFQIAQVTDLAVGTTYPILRRLVDAGWLVDSMEDAGRAELEGRPRRRYYQLTAEGRARAYNAVAEAEHRRRRIDRRFRPAPGGLRGVDDAI